MKKYLFFPTYTADWSLSPQYVLCGSPRIAILNPISNASTFLWEQIQPDPLTSPVSITPNNTSKNINVVIPNDITTNIILRVTLNGDTSNYKYVEIIPLLLESLYTFNKGKGLITSNNTLNDPINLLLAPYVPAGSQAIYYTNSSQLTGVRLTGQQYRNTYVNSIDVIGTTTTNVVVYRTIYDFTNEQRININVNTDYNFLKKWFDIKVLSQEITPIKQRINLTYPTVIADDYLSTFSKGKGSLSFQRDPFLVANYNLSEDIYNNFSKGQGSMSFTRDPFLVASYVLTEDLYNNFSKGKGLMTYIRTPYTSNIIG